MNFVFIMTDTQNKSMVGAYGNPKVDTPNLDRFAQSGIRFERAYKSWRTVQPAYYLGGRLRSINLPDGFPFEPSCIHADGSCTNK